MSRKDRTKACLGLLEKLISRYSRALLSRHAGGGVEAEEQGEASLDNGQSIFTGVGSKITHESGLNGVYDLILLVCNKSSNPEWWSVCDYINMFFFLVVTERLSDTDEELINLIFHTDFSTQAQGEEGEGVTHSPLSDKSVECSLHSLPTTSSSSQNALSREKRDQSKLDDSTKLLYAVQALLDAEQGVVGACSLPGQLFCTLMGCKVLRLQVQRWCLCEALTGSTLPSQEGDPIREGGWGNQSQSSGVLPTGPPEEGIFFLSRLRPGLVSSDFLLCAESWTTLRAVFLPGVPPSTRVPIGMSIDAQHTVAPTRGVTSAICSVELSGGFASQRCFSAELLSYCFQDLEGLLCAALRCKSYLARQEALHFVEDVISDPKYTSTRGMYLSSTVLLHAVLSTINEKSASCSELTFNIIKAFAHRLTAPGSVRELLTRSRSEILRFVYQYSTFLNGSGIDRVHGKRIFASIEGLRTSLEPFSSVDY